jgi:FkbM family methyltransferase
MRAIFLQDAEEGLKEAFFAASHEGFFVDVGANEPRTWSQTWHLEQAGWRGILIEPQPDLARRLRQERKATVFDIACSSPENSGKSLPLHVAGLYTSLNPDFFVNDMRRDGVIAVPVRTLDDILIEAKAPAPIDFVSIDVESHEIDVLRGFDLDRWRPRLLLIEDLVMNRHLHRYLQVRGYKWVRRTGLNSWYVPASSPVSVSLLGRLQFLRKYYLSIPFRHLRQIKRRIQVRLWGPRPRKPPSLGSSAVTQKEWP